MSDPDQTRAVAGGSSEHRRRIRTAAIALPLLLAVIAVVWVLDSDDATADYAYVSVLAISAIVAGLLGNEVLSIGADGGVGEPLRTLGAVGLGLVPVLLGPAAQSVVEDAPELLRFEPPVVEGDIFVSLTAVLWLIAAAAFVALTMLRGRRLVWRYAMPIAFGLYGSLALALVPEAFRTLDGSGAAALAWLLAMVFAADTAAFYVGRRWGRTKLAPTISPKKTVEGFFGGAAAAMLVLGGPVVVWLLVGADVRAPASADWLWYLFAAVAWVLSLVGFGLLVATLGTAGDLFASWFKRLGDVKDSGGLLPGHGGLLDRLDSLLPNLTFLTVVGPLGAAMLSLGT